MGASQLVPSGCFPAINEYLHVFIYIFCEVSFLTKPEETADRYRMCSRGPNSLKCCQNSGKYKTLLVATNSTFDVRKLGASHCRRCPTEQNEPFRCQKNICKSDSGVRMTGQTCFNKCVRGGSQRN